MGTHQMTTINATALRGKCARTGRAATAGEVVSVHFAGLPHECYTIVHETELAELRRGRVIRPDDLILGGTTPSLYAVI